MIIYDYIMPLRPFGGKNLPLADFAFTFLDISELCTNAKLEGQKFLNFWVKIASTSGFATY